jgi:hypothetical protein
MIHSYLTEDLIPFHLPGDEKDPSVFWAHPMTGRATAKWQAIQAHAGKKIVESLVDDTADRVLKIVDAQMDRQVSFLTGCVDHVDNIHMGGKHWEKVEDDNLTAYIEGLLTTQREHLIAALQDDIQLRELTCRDRAVSPAACGEETA